MFQFLRNKLCSLFNKQVPIPIDSLEELLYESDFGAELTSMMLKNIKPYYNPSDHNKNLSLLKSNLIDIFSPIPPLCLNNPHVIILVGINGSGKTSSAAKLANYFQNQSKKVVLIAADTFRAAAQEQLLCLSKTIQCDIIKGLKGGDPSAVVFDGIKAGISRKADVIIIDTAGRLHISDNHMKELLKIVSTCTKALARRPDDIFITLDATIGQNAIQQILTFNSYIPISGIISTKLDGSSKGGTLFNIYKKTNIPVRFITHGESISDISEFKINDFIENMFASH